MGDPNVSQFSQASEKHHFTKLLIRDIKALETMLNERMFEDDILRIGAEQELVIAGNDWYPAMTYDEILETINDDHFTTELARFNFEINADPLVFKDDSLSKLENQLKEFLMSSHLAAKKSNSNILLMGILPTITWDHLTFDHMTPNPRYKALNDVIKGKRKSNFEVNITGFDELITSHPNILFEACNTSFQVHMQVTQDQFVPLYNWAQAIAGPVLSVSCNSPLLMGKRLWAETRIALFQQSIDLRNTSNLKRDVEPRVSFGNRWLENSAVELYQDNVSRFNLLFASEIEEDSIETLKNGEIPKLKALCMHNGTVYMWNRICYGISDTKKPHLRIENRYLPSGPTLIDEIANSAFWLGLMNGIPDDLQNINKLMKFEDVHFNFYNAARLGLDCSFRWLGKVVSPNELLTEQLLPWARNGLKKSNVDQNDIDRLLGIIENRLEKNVTGSSWLQKNFSTLISNSTRAKASTDITQAYYEMQRTERPVHEWEDLDNKTRITVKDFQKVKQIMATDIPTLQKDDLLELAINIMVWRSVRCIAVEDDQNELVGLIPTRRIIKILAEGWHEDMTVNEVMVKELITTNPDASISDAVELMVGNKVGCLPVISNKKLVGMLTERDIVTISNMSKKFD